MRSGAAARYGLRAAALGYLLLLLALPLSMIVYYTFRDGLEPVWDALTDPAFVSALKLTLLAVGIAVPVNTIFGVACAMALVRRPPKHGTWLLNSLIGLPLALSPDRRRAGADPRVRQGGLARRLADRERDPDHLLHAGHRPRHDVRHAPVRRSRGDPGSARGRDRPGRGRVDAGCVALPDLLANHASGHPLGRRLRRRAHDGAGPRGVRRGRGRVRPDRRQDRDAHVARERGVPAVQRGGRVHDVARACACSPCSP